eukprot:789163_1
MLTFNTDRIVPEHNQYYHNKCFIKNTKYNDDIHSKHLESKSYSYEDIRIYHQNQSRTCMQFNFISISIHLFLSISLLNVRFVYESVLYSVSHHTQFFSVVMILISTKLASESIGDDEGLARN